MLKRTLPSIFVAPLCVGLPGPQLATSRLVIRSNMTVPNISDDGGQSVDVEPRIALRKIYGMPEEELLELIERLYPDDIRQKDCYATPNSVAF